jgi:hypothetical protein
MMGEVMSVSPHTNQGINGHGSLGKHEQRVYIKFLDMGTVSFSEASHGHDGSNDGLLITRLATEAFDKFPNLKRLQSAGDFFARSWQQ